MKTSISRREFIQASSATGALMLIGYASSAGDELLKNLTASDPKSLNQFIMIDGANHVVLFNHRPEMGQGTFNSIPMILAEELEVDFSAVEVRPSEANEGLYGNQNVVGSRSIQTEYSKLRKMGAAAKWMLIAAAAKRWSVPEESCTAKSGYVIHSSGKKLSYGELVEEASKLPVPTDPKLKDPKDFTIIGRPTPRQDVPVKVSGKAIFGMDVSVPGMKYASIEHSPVWLGKVVKFDKEAAMKVPGVTHVETTKRTVWGRTVEGVAVVADNYWAALQGRKKLNVVWDHQGLDAITSATLQAKFKTDSAAPGDVLHGVGDTDAVFKSGAEVIESTYELPYQAHVPMEPMNVVVNVKEASAEYWGSTQNPNGMRSFLAKTYNIAPENVAIHYTFMGGGFGRRSMSDVVEEAADLSKKTGAPIKLIWTREDDQTQGPFRNCSMNICRAVLNSDGTIQALEHKIVAQEINNQSGDNKKAGRQLMGGVTTDYAIPNVSIRGVLQKLHIPISYWRAVYHSTNPFAHESFIDELARRAGKDPLDFRLSMLKNHARYTRVLTETARVTKWYEAKKPGVGRGLAMVERSGAHFAMVIEVVRDGSKIKPVKVTTVVDLGVCINPDTVKAQTEGSIIMGLSAVYAGLTVDKGAIVEKNFDKYPLLRYDQCPDIETFILDSSAPPDGAGESGLPTVAPALANAIFDLTGKRIRKLPVDPGVLV